MPSKISGKLFSSDASFQPFIDKIFTSERFLKLARTNPVEAMAAEGLDSAKCPLKPKELQGLLESISSIKAAALKEGKKLSAKQIFEAIFVINETDVRQAKVAFNVNIRSEMSGKQTGYNEGWSNSSSRTAVTREGTHKIFPYESHNGPLVSPAERVVLAKKAGAIAKLIRTK